MEAITYHRKPTKGEIKFGEGATVKYILRGAQIGRIEVKL